jgi:hypothetical protein
MVTFSFKRKSDKQTFLTDNTFQGFYFLKLLNNSTYSYKIKPQLYNDAIQRRVPVRWPVKRAERIGLSLNFLVTFSFKRKSDKQSFFIESLR